LTELPSRWTTLRYHPEQWRLWNSNARFRVVPAGRRSGKTEIAIRKTILAGLEHTTFSDARFALAAPTRDQAKEIFWDKLKDMTPTEFIAGYPKETELLIQLVHGPSIRVVGMDKPQRIEGRPLDGIVMDEFAQMKPDGWTKSVRPALDTPGREGWAWFIGVPRGRNHYWKLFKYAARPDAIGWEAFHWKSADILPASTIDAARRDMDKRTFEQEYEASFLDFSGRAYYPFRREMHAAERLSYIPTAPLIFCFDFNVKPGVAVVAQEQPYRGSNPKVAENITAVIGEVWIPDNSNTPAVCRRLVSDWKTHEGEVYCYGDFTGGNRGAAQTQGNNWDLIRMELSPVFQNRLGFFLQQNPREIDRVNCMNTRLEAASGTVNMLVDPAAAPHVVEDLEGVVLLEGGSGEIEKKPGSDLTHLTDGLGYYIWQRWPIYADEPVVEQIY